MAPVDKSKVVKPLKPKSMIWPYYEDKLDGAHVLCKVCKDQHGREHQVKVPGGSTSSMIFHLRQHKNEFKKYEADNEDHEKEVKKKRDAKGRSILELGIGSSSSSFKTFKQPKVDDAFLKMNKYSLKGPMQKNV